SLGRSRASSRPGSTCPPRFRPERRIATMGLRSSSTCCGRNRTRFGKRKALNGSTDMLRNRSVPMDVVLPHLVYEDVPKAVDWLTKVFGFTEHYRYGEPADGAQMYLGEAWIMLKRVRAGCASPAKIGCFTQ